MITGIRQKTIVKEGGKIEVSSSELPTGATVEVIVFVDLDEPNTLEDRSTLIFPKGVQGEKLLRFVGSIQADDLELMRKAIEEECERIDGGKILWEVNRYA